jgi:NAD(P)-dependent dehydrogenase (short-subunit alcohol dehydrogenase family)
MEMARKVWLITGASKGFGRELTKVALDAGDTVVATARNPKTIDEAFGKHDRLLTLRLDVTSEQQAKEAVDTALKQFGQIDVLVNNAGRGLVGAVEEVTSEEVRAAFAVNVEGTLNVLRAALPSMRARKSGHILNLSAVGGFVSWPGWGIYCATKFMVEGFSGAMQAELKPLGIKLTIIEPGPHRTDFLDASSLQRSKNVIGDYGETAGAAREWADHAHNSQPGDPAKAAAAMVKITEVENPPLRLQLGADCVAAVEAKLDQVKVELNQWRDLAMSTAYTDNPTKFHPDFTLKLPVEHLSQL